MTTIPTARLPKDDKFVDPQKRLTRRWARWAQFIDASVRRLALGLIGTFAGLSDTPVSYTGTAGKYARVNAGASALEFTPLTAPAYTVASLPMGGVPGQIIYISDDAGGATLAFWDGATWKRSADLTVVAPVFTSRARSRPRRKVKRRAIRRRQRIHQ